MADTSSEKDSSSSLSDFSDDSSTPYLFILCAEVLGNAVRNDNTMQGIKVLDTECKISQYADDTNFILDGSQSSFTRALYLLRYFRLDIWTSR